MRKILAIGLMLAMVIIGFTAMVNPVASDDCGDVDLEKDADGVCYWGGLNPSLWDNDNVPLNTFVAWYLTITVTNNHGHDLLGVTVKDRLGAELMLLDADKSTPEIDEVGISQGDWSYYTKGNSDKVFLFWDVGDLGPGESATLTIGIGTDENPSGRQEYTTPGCYWLNSGATAKWIDPTDGLQYSTSSNQIKVIVVGEEED
jgi:hypothetical protein